MATLTIVNGKMQIRGRIGKSIVFKTRNGELQVCRYPKQARKPAGLTVQQQRFRRAASAASAALEDPAIRAFFQARALPGKTAYNLAMAHYLDKGSFGNLPEAGVCNDWSVA